MSIFSQVLLIFEKVENPSKADAAYEDQCNKRGWSPYSWHGGSILAIAGIGYTTTDGFDLT